MLVNQIQQTAHQKDGVSFWRHWHGWIHTSIELHIKRKQDKSHRAISSNIQEQLAIFNTPFIIKTTIKFGMVSYLNVLITMYYNYMPSIILNGIKLNGLPLRVGTSYTI